MQRELVTALDILFTRGEEEEVVEEYRLSFADGHLNFDGESLAGPPNRQLTIMMRKLLIVSNMLRPLAGTVDVKFRIHHKEGTAEDYEPLFFEPGGDSIMLNVDDEVVDWDVGEAVMDGRRVGIRFRGLHDMVDPDRMQDEQDDVPAQEEEEEEEQQQELEQHQHQQTDSNINTGRRKKHKSGP